MYAIINKRTKKFMYGTDYTGGAAHTKQLTSRDKAKLYDDEEFARADLTFRKCGKDYKVFKVHLVVLHEV